MLLHVMAQKIPCEFDTLTIKKRTHYQSRCENEDGEMELIISDVPARYRNAHVPLNRIRNEKGKYPYQYIYSGFVMDWHLHANLPQRYFARQASLSLGFSLGLEYQPLPKLPFTLGIHAGPSIYSVSNRLIDLPVSLSGAETYNLPVYVQTRGSLFFIHAVSRWWIPCRIVQPYLMGVFGFQYVTSKMNLYDVNAGEPEASIFPSDEGLIYSFGLLGSTSFEAGAGGGFVVNLSQYYNLDFRCMYTATGSVRYYSGTDLQNGELAYSGMAEDFYAGNYGDGLSVNKLGRPRRSPWDMIWCSLGINVLFR